MRRRSGGGGGSVNLGKAASSVMESEAGRAGEARRRQVGCRPAGRWAAGELTGFFPRIDRIFSTAILNRYLKG